MAANVDQPAAPVAQTTESLTHTIRLHQGLTKREVAAIAAMQGLLASEPGYDEFGVAMEAVKHADALFAELAKGAQA